MSQHYNQNYTKEQIEAILLTIQDCVRRNRFIISKNENRRENIDFINNYNLSSAKQKDILLKIEPEDFCHSLQNTNLGFEHETLYVFCPQMNLFNFDGEEEFVDIYTKFNIIEYDAGKRVIAISFHKRNKPLDYLFR
jgi:hypothetical protein